MSCLHVDLFVASRRSDQEKDLLRTLFDKYAEPILDWVMEGVDGDELVRKPRQIIPATKLNMIMQLTSLLDFHLSEYEENVKDTQASFMSSELEHTHIVHGAQFSDSIN